jgi:hypothetical protein
MPRRNAPRFLDPEGVPFTAREIGRAAALLWSSRLARKFVAVVTREARHLDRRRAVLRRRGYSTDRHIYAFPLPEEILAALTVVSPDTAARVTPLMKARWKNLRNALIDAERVAAARRTGLIPTKAQLRRLARKAGIHQATGRPDDLWRGVVVKLPRLPKPTATMVAAANKKLDRAKRRWEAQRFQYLLKVDHTPRRGLTSA